MFCPKCRCEYDEGYTVCGDCGIELVESLEHKKRHDDSNSYFFGNEVLLFTAIDKDEAHTVCDLLDEESILNRAAVSVENDTEYDIFIPEAALFKADKIIDRYLKQFDEEPTSDTEETEGEI